MATRKHRIEAYLSEDERLRLKHLAAEVGMTQSELIRVAIIEKLANLEYYLAIKAGLINGVQCVS